RSNLATGYNEASASFSFDAHDSRPECGPEIYVLVIGETSRAGNWQLNGYGRPTNPGLSRRDGIINYPKALSESNTTHKSVPLMMSHLDSENFGDSIYCSKGIVDAFAEAGYTTCWISSQQRNGQLIDYFGERADEVTFICDDGRHHYDMELCPLLDKAIATHADDKLFIVVHTYGSHYNYNERYPAEYNVFAKHPATEATPANRNGLIDAYDNSIAYVDAVLDSIIDTVEKYKNPAAVLYLADHGEDIYDDARKRFLHASPTPTYWQLHVPMLMWMSESYRATYPQRHRAAMANSRLNVSSSRSAFHTMLDLAGVSSPFFISTASLCSPSYAEPRRKYLNDYNEAVPLSHSGLRSSDFAELIAHRISI
ncbi:MAG: phosphoethanolamine transferase, partial [Muribaculaceae bacterium]|nr:phosphoethanolamine transferase [Muribaculaceae bacterium]